jgi:hypothetical protein
MSHSSGITGASWTNLPNTSTPNKTSNLPVLTSTSSLCIFDRRVWKCQKWNWETIFQSSNHRWCAPAASAFAACVAVEIFCVWGSFSASLDSVHFISQEFLRLSITLVLIWTCLLYRGASWCDGVRECLWKLGRRFVPSTAKLSFAWLHFFFLAKYSLNLAPRVEN